MTALKVQIAYGETGLDVDLPTDRTTVIVPTHTPPAADPHDAVRAALREPIAGPPLRDVVRRGQTVAISVCDRTRAQPRRLVIPAILDEIADRVKLADVVILIATGTHRGNTGR